LPVSPGFDPVLIGVKRSDHPILGHIDPYGTTVYTGIQLESLIQEIESLPAETVTELGGVAYLDTVIALSKECMAGRYFMWFVGD
jgi:hypothetical protein